MIILLFIVSSRALCKSSMAGLALHPTHAEGFNQLGQALRQMRRNDEALRAFQRALVLMPISTLPWNNIASVHRNDGNEEAAMRASHMVEIINEMTAEWAGGPRRRLPAGASEVGECSYGARMTGPERKARDEAAAASGAGNAAGRSGGAAGGGAARRSAGTGFGLDKVDDLTDQDVTCEMCHARALGFCYSEQKGMSGKACVPGKCVSNKIAGNTPPCGCGPHAHFVGEDQAGIPIVAQFGVPVGCPGDEVTGRTKRRRARGKSPLPLRASVGAGKKKKKGKAAGPH